MRQKNNKEHCRRLCKKARVQRVRGQEGLRHDILQIRKGADIVNEKQEKKRRYNLRLEYIAHFNKWLDSEPPRWRFIRWRKWKNSRPVWEDAA